MSERNENVVNFEKAVREKTRFPFKGLISVEQLWDLKLADLDEVFKNLNKTNKQAAEESLLDTKTSEQRDVQEKIEIVKYIVRVKQDEAKKLQDDVEKVKRRTKILEALGEKDEAEFKSKSKAELEEMLKELM